MEPDNSKEDVEVMINNPSFEQDLIEKIIIGSDQEIVTFVKNLQSTIFDIEISEQTSKKLNAILTDLPDHLQEKVFSVLLSKQEWSYAVAWTSLINKVNGEFSRILEPIFHQLISKKDICALGSLIVLIPDTDPFKKHVDLAIQDFIAQKQRNGEYPPILKPAPDFKTIEQQDQEIDQAIESARKNPINGLENLCQLQKTYSDNPIQGPKIQEAINAMVSILEKKGAKLESPIKPSTNIKIKIAFSDDKYLEFSEDKDIELIKKSKTLTEMLEDFDNESIEVLLPQITQELFNEILTLLTHLEMIEEALQSKTNEELIELLCAVHYLDISKLQNACISQLTENLLFNKSLLDNSTLCKQLQKLPLQLTQEILQAAEQCNPILKIGVGQGLSSVGIAKNENDQIIVAYTCNEDLIIQVFVENNNSLENTAHINFDLNSLLPSKTAAWDKLVKIKMSPNGKFIAFKLDDTGFDKIFVYAMENLLKSQGLSKAVYVYTQSANIINEFDFCPNEKMFAISMNDDTYILNLEHPQKRISIKGIQANHIAFNQNGSQIALSGNKRYIFQGMACSETITKIFRISEDKVEPLTERVGQGPIASFDNEGVIVGFGSCATPIPITQSQSTAPTGFVNAKSFSQIDKICNLIFDTKYKLFYLFDKNKKNSKNSSLKIYPLNQPKSTLELSGQFDCQLFTHNIPHGLLALGICKQHPQPDKIHLYNTHWFALIALLKNYEGCITPLELFIISSLNQPININTDPVALEILWQNQPLLEYLKKAALITVSDGPIMNSIKQIIRLHKNWVTKK